MTGSYAVLYLSSYNPQDSASTCFPPFWKGSSPRKACCPSENFQAAPHLAPLELPDSVDLSRNPTGGLFSSLPLADPAMNLEGGGTGWKGSLLPSTAAVGELVALHVKCLGSGPLPALRSLLARVLFGGSHRSLSSRGQVLPHARVSPGAASTEDPASGSCTISSL